MDQVGGGEELRKSGNRGKKYDQNRQATQKDLQGTNSKK